MHHFIDEAGDLSLFNKRKQIVVGREGVSNFFIVGVAYIPEPGAVEAALIDLRRDILVDPFLNRVPSLDPERRKTAISFHAKDDIPEVRHRVFRLLNSFDIKVFAAIRRKHALIDQARLLHQRGRRISENEIYDDLVSRLLANRLHLAESNQIIVARRGTKDRKKGLTQAITTAQSRFQARWGRHAYGPVEVATAMPHQFCGLQAIDYFLWALQRMLERGEDRFFAPLMPHYRIVMDLDDTRRKRYGEWYSDANPLTLEKLKPVTG